MKAKILIGIALGVIGAIYAFLVYPLLQSPESVILNEDISTGDQSVIPALLGVLPKQDEEMPLGREPGSIDSGSSPEGQINNIQEKELTANSQQLKANTICFNSDCFTIEIADTPATRQQGLMNRPSLPQNAGMLFVFDRLGSHGFWMKNTLIPLDIIRMDDNFVVVDTATMLPCTADPCPTYNHSGQAMYALEINVGLVEQYNIQIGDIFIQQ